MDLTPEIVARYKKMSNAELLEIFQNPSTYLPEALSIAQSEFYSRQLSEDDILEANEILKTKNEEKEKSGEKIEKAKAKAVDAGSALYELVNPIQASLPTAERLVRLITISFTVLLVINVTMHFRFLAAVLRGDFHSGFNYTVFLFPILVEAVAIILFWRKSQIGWIFLTAFCSSSLVVNCYAFYQAVKFRSGSSILDHFFPRPNPMDSFIPIIFYAGTTLVLNRKDLRAIFSVKRETIPAVLITGALVAIVMYFLAAAG